MTRKEFLDLCGLFGISLPFHGVITACRKDNKPGKPFPGKVIVIGAGAGGLSAAYYLKQQGTACVVLEASPSFGGRMRVNTDFADFPIPLGAEWLETTPKVLDEIVNNPAVGVNVSTFPDLPDRKFLDYSWFNFFEDYIAPAVSADIVYNILVQSVDYSGNQVVVTSNNGQWKADRVILSVPLQMLKENTIQFTPSLPKSKQDAIRDAPVWAGFKAFFEFGTNFYGDTEYAFDIQPETDGQKIYYNAAFGQQSDRHILGLFAVGKPALELGALSGDDLRKQVLRELDGIYKQQATPNFLRYLAQDWNKEPHIRSGYLSDFAPWKTVRELGRSIDNKLFFAGAEFTDGEDWVSVHTAAKAARMAVDEINREA
jgi:monoamine oxidase